MPKAYIAVFFEIQFSEITDWDDSLRANLGLSGTLPAHFWCRPPNGRKMATKTHFAIFVTKTTGCFTHFSVDDFREI